MLESSDAAHPAPSRQGVSDANALPDRSKVAVEPCDVGLYGLAVMGANLARNMARNGFAVAVHNRSVDKTDDLIREFGGDGRLVRSDDLAGFVASIRKPRAIIVMVKAGDAVQAVVDAIAPLLDPGDAIVDAGNSLFEDTERRSAELLSRGLDFVGLGISGGEEGALHGPSLMPGGPKLACERLEPILVKIAARFEDEPCSAYIGPGAAGHYVKMVHNGIEYADMQIIAEVYDLLRSVYAMGAGEVADLFAVWNDGKLESYLVEITATVLREVDPVTGQPLLDLIKDRAEQKGTGRWTARDGLGLGVPLTVTTEAVQARVLSANDELRLRASLLLPAIETPADQSNVDVLADLENAFYAARLVAYAQGFEMMAAASNEHGWDLKLDRIAAIWRAGCIIRARLLQKVMQAQGSGADPDTMLLHDAIRPDLLEAEPGLRRVVALAAGHGVAVPALSSALAYLEGLRRTGSTANLIQGLRDLFGSHGYERRDRPGSFHTEWGGDASSDATPEKSIQLAPA